MQLKAKIEAIRAVSVLVDAHVELGTVKQPAGRLIIKKVIDVMGLKRRITENRDIVVYHSESKPDALLIINL